MKTRVRHGFTASILAIAATAMCAFPSLADVNGTLDAGSTPAISGWAVDAENPDSNVSVTLYVYTDGAAEATELAKVTADQYRNDLTDMEGNGHAFSYTVDWSAMEGTDFLIEAYTETADGREKLDGTVTYKKETVIPPILGSGEAAADSTEAADTAADTKASAEETNATGPAAEINGAPAASGKKGTYLGKFTTTAYCNCSACCSGGFTLTYSGTVPKANHTISADIARFPIGTKLMINDIIYTVEDIGSNVYGNRLDIYFDTHQQALDYGRKTVDVYAVE